MGFKPVHDVTDTKYSFRNAYTAVTSYLTINILIWKYYDSPRNSHVLYRFMEGIWNAIMKLPYFSIDNMHLMYNAHPKPFLHSFLCIDNAHDAN
jgi:hypothetical protein